MAEFKLPPISPLAGTSVLNYFKILNGNPIHPRHWLKTALTFIIILIATPFRWYEHLRFGNRVKNYVFKEPPIFILGHWRSGTTYLHNVMCQDPKTGYMTTYHSLWPRNLGSKLIFKTFTHLAMPKKRPSDNVELAVDYPQEDDFALSNLIPYVFYLFWYFPRRWRDYYEKYVRFKDVSERVIQKWNDSYRELVVKSLLNTGGDRAIFKNPVSTARINRLLGVFPDAKFVHIHRNPIVVYLSTKKFFIELFPTLTFQPIEEEEIIEMVFENYEKMMKDYLDQYEMIPEGRFVEVGFEAFERDPMNYLEFIYHELTLVDFEKAKPHLEAYVEQMGSYQKNKYYTITRTELNRILERWDFAMKKWGYEVPENLKIVEE